MSSSFLLNGFILMLVSPYPLALIGDSLWQARSAVVSHMGAGQATVYKFKSDTKTFLDD